MHIRDFLDSGKVCRVCGDASPKRIVVSPYILDLNAQMQSKVNSEAEVKDDKLVFRVGTPEAYQLFSFNVDEHKAERKIYNPKNSEMLYANNFQFTLACQHCDSYRLESSLITFHPMGSLTSNIYLDSEKITIRDDDNVFIIKNSINEDKVMIIYLCNNNIGVLDAPFIKMKDLPIRSKAKMLRKLRTLMLLS